MNIVMHTTFYHPHISGLTLYFKRLAEHYVQKGHAVTLIAAQHDKTLAAKETVSGVKVVRVPYLIKFNKGLFVPQMGFYAWRPVRQADIVHLNLPSLEALCIALTAKLLRKKVVSTYVCDLHLPPFPGSKMLTTVIDRNHTLTLKLSDTIVSFTHDFARHSRVLKKLNREVLVIYPSIEIPECVQTVETLTDLTSQGFSPLIGMVTRFASDKGIEYCLEALPGILVRFPRLKLVIAGDMHTVGEERYMKKLTPLLEKYRSTVCCLGQLNQNQLSHFYQMIDLLVVASTNSTEAFGIVQIEAMAHGTPVVATNLAGVTIPVTITGMGEIARRADSDELGRKIIAVLTDRKSYYGDIDKIRELFSVGNAARHYLDLYNRVLDG